jgi:hypothetical protein
MRLLRFHNLNHIFDKLTHWIDIFNILKNIIQYTSEFKFIISLEKNTLTKSK